MTDGMTARSQLSRRLGRVGVWSPELRRLGTAATDVARGLEAAGWKAIWIPNATGPGIWVDAERLLDATTTATIATGVTSIWGDDARQAPEVLARLGSRHPDRLLPGFGVSSPRSAAAAGSVATTPLRDMTAYLDYLDTAPTPVPASRRVLGALGPKMVALAERRAAGIHPFLVTTESIRASREVMPDSLIAPHLAVVLDDDPAGAREIARRGVGMYFGFPSYQANLQRLGFTPDELEDGGSDRLIDAVTAHGTLDAIAQRIRDYMVAGADHVALQVLSASGSSAPTAEWARLAELVGTDLS